MVYEDLQQRLERSLVVFFDGVPRKTPNQSLLTLNNNINIELANPFMGDI